MFVCLTGMEKMLLNWRKNSKLGRRGAFFHCVHSAFLLTVSSHMAGKSPNAILALAIGSCSLITKENLSHHWQMLRFRSWNWKPKGLNQKTEMPKKKKKRKSPTKTSHFTAHIAHASLHGERKREPEPPTTDVRRSVSGTSGSCLGSMLRSAVQDTTENFTTKILADTAHGRCISREEGLKTKLS